MSATPSHAAPDRVAEVLRGARSADDAVQRVVRPALGVAERPDGLTVVAVRRAGTGAA